MSGSVGECLEVSRSVWKGPEVGSFFYLPRHCVVVVGGLSWGVSAVDKDSRRQRPPTIQQFDIWIISVLRFQSSYINVGEYR